MSNTSQKTLFEKTIVEIHNAWKDIRNHPHKNTAGADNISIRSFGSNATKNIASIRDSLKKGTYHFAKLRPVKIQQRGKEREILVQTVSDRIVSRAILRVIQPKFKKYYSGSDYSVKRMGRREELNGIPLAAQKMQEKLKEGYEWVFETDIKNFFDAIPKDKILEIIKDEISDPHLFKLIQEIVNFQVDQATVTSIKQYSNDDGIAQGSSVSPLLASIYLSSFDKSIQAQKDVYLVRYVDDLVILCKTEARANEIYALVDKELKELGLEIHELNVESSTGKVKTKITNSKKNSFVFLGLNFNFCNIDISKDKKDKCIEDIKDILYGEKGSLIVKSQKIFKKLESFIRQYAHKHYKAQDSLESLCIQADKMLEEYYIKNIKRIIGFDPSTKLKLNEVQVKGLYDFIGINLRKKLVKFR